MEALLAPLFKRSDKPWISKGKLLEFVIKQKRRRIVAVGGRWRGFRSLGGAPHFCFAFHLFDHLIQRHAIRKPALLHQLFTPLICHCAPPIYGALRASVHQRSADVRRDSAWNTRTIAISRMAPPALVTVLRVTWRTRHVGRCGRSFLLNVGKFHILPVIALDHHIQPIALIFATVAL